MENGNTAKKQLQLKDPSYWKKVKEIAKIHYTENPDKIKPEELVKFNLERNTSRVLRMLIDKEYNRLQSYSEENKVKA